MTLFCSKVDASARKSKKCLAICGFAGRGSYRCAISYVSSSLGTQCRSAVQERCLTSGALFELFVVACCCIFCKKNLLGVMRLQICKCLKHSLYADYYWLLYIYICMYCTYTYQKLFNSHFAEAAKKATCLASAPILRLAGLGHKPS